jgi:succinyl-CoA synthetase alpha subunit
MIILNKDSQILVQGITGREGTFHTRLMMESGTNVVAGVTPGRGGSFIEGIPVYNTINTALSKHPQIKMSVIFVPPAQCFDAILEAIDASLQWVIVITEGIPVKDTLWLVNYARYKRSHIIGPNCPGLISPGKTNIGIMPASAFSLGDIGLVSRSGTLTYEVGSALKENGFGVSTAIGIGGDPIVGTSLLEVAMMFEADSETSAMVLLGEIGGGMEEELASTMKEGAIAKPVVAFMAGITAPPGKKMGHAGAILQSGANSAKDKLDLLVAAGAHSAQTPWEIPDVLKKIKQNSILLSK